MIDIALIVNTAVGFIRYQCFDEKAELSSKVRPSTSTHKGCSLSLALSLQRERLCRLAVQASAGSKGVLRPRQCFSQDPCRHSLFALIRAGCCRAIILIRYSIFSISRFGTSTVLLKKRVLKVKANGKLKLNTLD